MIGDAALHRWCDPRGFAILASQLEDAENRPLFDTAETRRPANRVALCKSVKDHAGRLVREPNFAEGLIPRLAATLAAELAEVSLCALPAVLLSLYAIYRR